MKWYPWLSEPYRALAHQYLSERAHHAVLLQASDGIGVEHLVQGLAVWLMCQHPDGEKTCGTCHSCQLMKAGTHPDWHILQPEKGKNSVGIEQARQLIDQVYARAHQGGRKVIWIPQADALSEAVANALLKTLEEPPEQTCFILTCRVLGEMLPTLRSRCFHYYLASPTEPYSLAWLQRQPSLASQPVLSLLSALRLSAGAPLAALMLLDSWWSQRLALCSALQTTLRHRDLLALLPELHQDNVSDRLHWLATLLLDASRWQLAGAEHLVNSDQASLVEWIAQSAPLEALQQIARDCLHCRYELLHVAGVNRELLLTERLCRWERWLADPDSFELLTAFE